MHNNYYFLKHLSAELKPILQSASLIECFSQNKDELIFGFSLANKEDFYIKAHLDPNFCCLTFPDDFSRAKKNSVNLMQPIINKKVIDTRQYLNERCFSLIFEDGFTLLFKMHGNRSNLILFQQNEIISVFKKNLKNDFDIDLLTIDRPIDQSFKAFEEHNGDIYKLYPTFGKEITAYLKEEIKIEDLSTEERWTALQNLVSELDKSNFHITEQQDSSLHLSLISSGKVLNQFDKAITAINFFFIKYISEFTIRNTKNQSLNQLNKVLKQTQSYITKTSKKLNQIKSESNYSQLADIIMANMHRIKPQTKTVELEDFYNNNAPISINLKKELSPQKNAENYYRKAKNQAIEIKALEENLDSKKELVNEIEDQILEIEMTEDLRELRSVVKKIQKSDTVQQDKGSRPFNAFTHHGYDIWVGKNAKNNDLMLQQYSYKEDLWLHAKDVSGSHVLIKQKAGKKIPKDVIEKAAELAAYYSKRKNDTLCPVIVTPRKYVRKRKGDPAGAVAVDKEEMVVLVRPGK